MCFADHLNLFSCTPTRLLNFKTIPSRLFQVLKKFLPPPFISTSLLLGTEEYMFYPNNFSEIWLAATA